MEGNTLALYRPSCMAHSTWSVQEFATEDALTAKSTNNFNYLNLTGLASLLWLLTHAAMNGCLWYEIRYGIGVQSRACEFSWLAHVA